MRTPAILTLFLLATAPASVAQPGGLPGAPVLPSGRTSTSAPASDGPNLTPDDLRLPPAGVITLVEHGLSDARFDLVVLGEGYAEHELPRFRAEARAVVERLLATAPVDRYRGYLNVHRVDVAARAATGLAGGRGGPAALGTRVGPGGAPEFDVFAVQKAARRARAADAVLVLVNDAITPAARSNVALARGDDPAAAASAAARLIGGLAEPTACADGSTAGGLAAACEEAVVLGLSARARPYDIDVARQDAGTLRLTIRSRVPGAARVTWRLDGKLVGDGPALLVTRGLLSRGENTLEVSIADPAVRHDPQGRATFRLWVELHEGWTTGVRLLSIVDLPPERDPLQVRPRR